MARQPAHAFVGRTSELAELIGAFQLAAASTPTFTLVSGDAGTGKTRLLQELVSTVESAGALALVGSCVQVGDFGLPYLPIVDALRGVESDPDGARVLRDEAAVRPALARLLPQLLPQTDSDQHSGAMDGLAQGQLFEALLRVLTVLAEKCPVVLILEDLHWADHSTRDLMTFLARTLRDGRVAVVASYRTDDLHRRHPLRPLLAELARLPHVRRVALEPFTRSELAQLLDELSGSPVDVLLVDQVFARSEGNAFFAEELIRAGRSTQGHGRLPDQLADVLLSRVEELGPAGRQAVRAAAVAGRRVGHTLLVAAAGSDDTEDGLREAVEKGLLNTDGETYTFRHALFQEAVYADLLPGERTRLHARFAELLGQGIETLGGPAELAYHRLASHDMPGALAASIEAATAAEAMAAPAEALRHLEQAVSLLDRIGSGGDRLDLLRRAAEAASASGEANRAVAFGEAAVSVADEHPEDVELRAATRERLARLLFDTDLDVYDNEPSRTAVELLPADHPSPLRAQALATRARAVSREDPAAAAAMLAEATRIAEATGADTIAADALITLNLLARRGYQLDAAAPKLSDVLARITGPEALGVRLRALRFQAAHQMEDGDLDGALAAATEGVRLSQEVGLSWGSWGLDLRLMRGWVLAALGHWDEVLAESLGAAHAPTAPGRVLATQAVSVLVSRGDPDAEHLLVRLRGTGDYYAEVQLDLCEIDLRLIQGRYADAVAVVRRSSQDPAWNGWATERLLIAARHAAALAGLAIQARERGTVDAEAIAAIAAARAVADDAEAKATAPGLAGPYGRAWVRRVRAEADRAAGTDTAEQWELVLKESVAAGRVHEQIYAAVRAAERSLEGGDRDHAAGLLQTALRQAQGLKAGPAIAAIKEIAQRGRLRLTADPVGQRTESPLTAREAEVLALVARGLSNRAIGDALFISDKTASVHLSHILGKLGATTRTQAVSLARQRGLLSD